MFETRATLEVKYWSDTWKWTDRQRWKEPYMETLDS